ncbi:Myb-binding protein 1A-like protein, partial [Stegodyphus mimosarum]
MDAKAKKIPKNILELFYKLSDTNTSIRVHACASILRILLKLQSENQNEGEVCKDLQYVLKRLIQGLASSREAARLGFTLLLREVLVHINTISVERILELIKRKLSLAKAEEKRDAIFGQLFAYTALVRSERLADDNHLPEVVLSIYELCQEKNYILIACYELTINLFTQLSKENFKENVWPHLKKKIFSGWENCTPDSIWLLLLCLRMFPEIIERYLTKHWGNCDVFSPENLEHHKNMIKQTGALLPQLHPYCLEFVALVKERKNIKEIWIPVVDENLFDIAHHEQRVYVGFEMIKKILQTTEKKKVIKCVLAPKFSSKFMNVYMHPKHVLNPAAEKMAAFLCNYAKENSTPEVQILILKTFLQMPSTVLLDRILKKKDVSELIQNLLPEAVKEFCELLKTVVLNQENENIEGKSVASSKYFYAVVQIGNLLSHPVMIGDIEWRLNIMKFLFLHSFFNVKVPCEDILHCEHACGAVPDKLREFFVSSFYKSFYSLSHTSKNQRTPLHQFLEYLLSLAEYADQLIASNENVSPAFPVEKIQEAWKHMKSIVQKLIKQDKKENIHEAKIFQTLLLQLGFHLFHDPQHIPEALEELNICCKKALKAQKQQDQSADEENEPPWIGVVVDVLLSLLSNSSHHMHRLIISVFPLLCPFITKEALQIVLDVINPQNPSQEDMEIESEENEEVEFVSESSSDEEVSNTDKVDEEFREKVKSA